MNSLRLSSSSQHVRIMSTTETRNGDVSRRALYSRERERERERRRVSAYYDRAIIPGIKLSLRLSLHRAENCPLVISTGCAGLVWHEKNKRTRTIPRNVFRMRTRRLKRRYKCARPFNVTLKVPPYITHATQVSIEIISQFRVINFIDIRWHI